MFWSPTSLNQIVGNENQLVLLRTMLAQRDLPGAVCLEGPSGVGKSTIASLFTKQAVQVNPVTVPPDRIDRTLQQDDIGQWGAVIWDGAEQISSEQARRIATLLDRTDIKLLSVFLSTDRIHQTLRGRVLSIRLTPPSRQELVGLLGAICAERHLTFELGALDQIASAGADLPSRAVRLLEAVSTLGPVSSSTVQLLQPDLAQSALRILTLIAKGENPMSYVDSVRFLFNPGDLIDQLFTTYSSSFFSSDPTLFLIRQKLSNYRRIGEIFVKWKRLPNPPPASLFILAAELAESDQVSVTVPLGPSALPDTGYIVPAIPSDMDELIRLAGAKCDPAIWRYQKSQRS